MSKLYLIQRRAWYGAYAGYEGALESDGVGVPVAAFTRRKDAERLAAELEQQARSEAISPFHLWYDLLEEDLEWTKENVVAAVQKLGLEPPEPVENRGYSDRYWILWYDALADTITTEQREGLWRLFEDICVYEVVVVPIEKE
jgi:hypothetical protein